MNAALDTPRAATNGRLAPLPTPTRELPHDDAAERALLGSIIVADELSRVIADVRAAMPDGAGAFFSVANARVFATIARAFDAGAFNRDDRFDVVLGGGADKLGGHDAVADLVESVPSWVRAAEYAGTIQRCADARKMIVALADAMARVYDGGDAAAEIDAVAATHAAATRETGISPASDLIRDFQDLPEPVIHGLIRRGETANLVAGSKGRKTWSVIALALAVASGREWFCMPTQRGRALLIDNELTKPVLAHRLRLVASTMGLEDDEWLQSVDVLSLRGDLRSVRDISTTLRAATKSSYSLISLDSLYKANVSGASENDNGTVTAQYALIDQIARDTGAAVICVLHTPKGDVSGRSVIDLASGAGAAARSVDAHIALRPHVQDDAVVLSSVLRSFAPPEDRAFRFDFPIFRPAPELDVTQLRMAAPKPRRDTNGLVELADRAEFVARCLSESPTARDAIHRAANGRWSRRAVEEHLVAGVGAGIIEMSIGSRGAHLFATPRTPRDV